MRIFSSALVAIAATTFCSQPVHAAEPGGQLRVGMIGLDTSHVIAFTDAINKAAPNDVLSGMRVVAGYPGGTDLPVSRDRVQKFTEQLREKGVEIVATIPELLDRVDVVLLESVDGRPHLNEATQVIRAGKPLFIDKPAAGSLADVIAIFELAQEHQVPCFSSSSLRFLKDVARFRAGDSPCGDVTGCATWGPCSLQPPLPQLYFYGIHGIEVLFAVMGPDCVSVSCSRTEQTDVVVGVWSDGRIGTYRGLRSGKAEFGGVVFGSTSQHALDTSGGYVPMLHEIATFFQTGKPPVDGNETIAIFAFMEAAEQSQRNGGRSVSIADVLRDARD